MEKNINIVKSFRIPFQVKHHGLFKFKNSFFLFFTFSCISKIPSSMITHDSLIEEFTSTLHGIMFSKRSYMMYW